MLLAVSYPGESSEPEVSWKNGRVTSQGCDQQQREETRLGVGALEEESFLCSGNPAVAQLGDISAGSVLSINHHANGLNIVKIIMQR